MFATLEAIFYRCRPRLNVGTTSKIREKITDFKKHKTQKSFPYPINFSCHPNANHSAHLLIYNRYIPYVPHFKFLGVVFDRNMIPGRRLKHIKAKCSSWLNSFRCLTSSECGANHTTLLRLYKAIDLPVTE